VLVSATFVELLPAPRVLSYVALFVLFAIALGALRMPEPVASRSRLRLTPPRPSVPPTVRRAFLLAALGAMSSWSIGGLFLALGPHLAARLLTQPTTWSPASASSPSRGRPRSRAAPVRTHGAVDERRRRVGALAARMVAIVLAASAQFSALFLAGAVIGGAGFGVAFLGALRALSAARPRPQPAAGGLRYDLAA